MEGRTAPALPCAGSGFWEPEKPLRAVPDIAVALLDDALAIRRRTGTMPKRAGADRMNRGAKPLIKVKTINPIEVVYTREAVGQLPLRDQCAPSMAGSADRMPVASRSGAKREQGKR